RRTAAAGAERRVADLARRALRRIRRRVLERAVHREVSRRQRRGCDDQLERGTRLVQLVDRLVAQRIALGARVVVGGRVRRGAVVGGDRVRVEARRRDEGEQLARLRVAHHYGALVTLLDQRVVRGALHVRIQRQLDRGSAGLLARDD